VQFRRTSLLKGRLKKTRPTIPPAIEESNSSEIWKDNNSKQDNLLKLINESVKCDVICLAYLLLEKDRDRNVGLLRRAEAIPSLVI
jgi:hypothetical protein